MIESCEDLVKQYSATPCTCSSESIDRYSVNPLDASSGTPSADVDKEWSGQVNSSGNPMFLVSESDRMMHRFLHPSFIDRGSETTTAAATTTTAVTSVVSDAQSGYQDAEKSEDGGDDVKASESSLLMLRPPNRDGSPGNEMIAGSGISNTNDPLRFDPSRRRKSSSRSRPSSLKMMKMRRASQMKSNESNNSGGGGTTAAAGPSNNGTSVKGGSRDRGRGKISKLTSAVKSSNKMKGGVKSKEIKVLTDSPSDTLSDFRLRLPPTSLLSSPLPVGAALSCHNYLLTVPFEA